VAWLEHRRLPRWAGASLAMLGALAIVIAGAYALRDDLMNVVETAPAAMNRLRDMIRRELGYPIGDSELAPQMQQAAAAIFALSGHVVVVFFLIFFLLLSGHQPVASGDARRDQNRGGSRTATETAWPVDGTLSGPLVHAAPTRARCASSEAQPLQLVLVWVQASRRCCYGADN
jgi:hypothetical protein